MSVRSNHSAGSVTPDAIFWCALVQINRRIRFLLIRVKKFGWTSNGERRMWWWTARRWTFDVRGSTFNLFRIFCKFRGQFSVEAVLFTARGWTTSPRFPPYVVLLNGFARLQVSAIPTARYRPVNGLVNPGFLRFHKRPDRLQSPAQRIECQNYSIQKNRSVCRYSCF